MKAAIMIIAGLALMDAITLLLLKREVRKRHEAEEKAEVARHNIEVLQASHNIKEEARSEADKKIDEVRSSNSDHDKFDAILRGMRECAKKYPD